MSVELQTAVINLVRGAFSRAELADVLPYSGEFGAEDVAKVSYTCPAVFVAVLGWRPAPTDMRLTGRRVRAVRMAAFVVTKHAQRAARSAAAMNLVQRLELLLESWQPTSTQLANLGPVEGGCTAENLHNAGIDKAGQALWLLDWVQAVQPLVPPAQLFDLLRVDIEDTVAQGVVPQVPPAPSSLVVTERVDFAPLPPPDEPT